jgi:hypothetical protein
MAKRSETREIGGHDVTVNQFDPTTALKLAPRVGKVLVPILPYLKGFDLKAGVESMSPALFTFFEQMQAQGDDLIPELLKGTSIVLPAEDETGKSTGEMRIYDLGQPGMFNIAFMGRLDLMMRVALFAAEVNFFRYFFARAPKPTPGATANQ